MRVTKPLLHGRLVRRYKRFLADVELDNGEQLTAHCPNPGRMIGCSTPGSAVVLRDSEDPKRKLRYTLQTIREGETWINVDTGMPNQVLGEDYETVPELRGYSNAKREVKYGENSRIDLLLTDEERPDCYVEVKSTTMAQDGFGLFPDAVTARGKKHLDELIEVVRAGDRAVMFFFISRGDVERFAPADGIDPDYSNRLREAAEAGVELLAWTSNVEADALTLAKAVPVVLDQRIELETVR